MKRWLFLILFLSCWTVEVQACPESMSDNQVNGCRSIPAGLASSSSALLGDTVVKTGSGVVMTCTILGGAQGNVTVYDDTVGGVATHAILPTFAYLATSPVTFSIPLNVAFSTGLVVSTTANTKWQCSYR